MTFYSFNTYRRDITADSLLLSIILMIYSTSGGYCISGIQAPCYLRLSTLMFLSREELAIYPGHFAFLRIHHHFKRDFSLSYDSHTPPPPPPPPHLPCKEKDLPPLDTKKIDGRQVSLIKLVIYIIMAFSFRIDRYYLGRNLIIWIQI